MAQQQNVVDTKNAFFVWIAKDIPSARLSDLYLAATELDEYCTSKKLLSTSIFDVNDKAVVTRLRVRLEGDRLFKFFNRGKTERMISVLKNYADYLSYVESQKRQSPTNAPRPAAVAEPKNDPVNSVKPVSTSKPVDTPKMEVSAVKATSAMDQFRSFLIKQGKKSSDIPLLIDALAKIDAFIAKSSDYDGSIVAAQNDTEASRIFLSLLADDTYHKLNRTHNGNCVSAAQLYIRMLKEGRSTVAPDSVHTPPAPQAPSKEEMKKLEQSTKASSIPSSNNLSEEQKTTTQQLVMDGVPGDPVLSYAERKGIAWIDKRQQNGCLWLIGDMGLYQQINELRKMGYDFRYAKEGGKATDGRPGWFLQRATQAMSQTPLQPVNKPSVVESEKHLSAELQALLAEDEYEPLRSCLLEHGILTLKQFEETNPWILMNRHGIYSISQRQTVYKQIMAKLKPAPEAEPEKLYILKTQTSSYQGNTPAAAFASFCESVAQKYPLKIRSLLDAPYNGKGSVVLSRTPFSGECAKIMNPVAYITGTLTAQAAVIYGQWICKMCNEPDAPVSMSEPKPIDKPKPPIEEPKPVPVPIQPQPVQPEKPVEKEDVTPKRPDLPKPPEPVKRELPNQRLVEKAEKIVLAADLDGMTLDDLNMELDTTMVATKQAAADSLHIVSIAGKLIHEEAFVDWEDGADQMEKILDKLLDKNNGYVSAAQFYEYVHADMQMFLNDNDMDEARAVYDMAQHLFEKVGYHGKHLVFQSKNHISRGETAVTSNLDIMRNFAREQGGVFTDEELEAYLKSVGVKTGNMRGQMQVYEKPIFLFYSEHTYITGESIGFDNAWFETAQKALDNLFADMGDHVVLRDIQPWWYTQLPTLPGGREWTALLLQSVLMHFSKNLNGTHTIYGLENQAGDTLHAMLVSGTSEINTFADAVVAFLIDEEIEQRRFEAEELRQLLVQRGMVAGNELIWKMPKVLAKDERFAWDADEQHVTVKV